MLIQSEVGVCRCPVPDLRKLSVFPSMIFALNLLYTAFIMLCYFPSFHGYIPWSTYIIISWCIYPLVDKCFSFTSSLLSIINDPGTPLHGTKFSFLWICVWNVIPLKLDHMVVIFLIFWGPSIRFSIWLSSQCARESLFLIKIPAGMM